MSGRHAAFEDVDDEARAAAEPDTPGTHRAEVPPLKPPPRKPSGSRATAPKAAAPKAATQKAAPRTSRAKKQP
jgi:hypothetical protein